MLTTAGGGGGLGAIYGGTGGTAGGPGGGGNTQATYSWTGDVPLQGSIANPTIVSYSTAGTKNGSVTATWGAQSTTTQCATSVAVTLASLCSGGVNIGLRAHDGTGIVDIAAKADTSSPIRIFKNGVTYSVLLTSDFADPKASKFRIRVPSGEIKAVCKL